MNPTVTWTTSQVPLGVVLNRRSREWFELNECLRYVTKVECQVESSTSLYDESEYKASVFSDPFTNKTTTYSINGTILYRNGVKLLTVFLPVLSVLFALSHVACLVSNASHTYIYDTSTRSYSFPFKSIVHVRFLYNLNKCVLTNSQHSFVVIGPDDYTADTMDDLVLFSPSGSCVCFTESQEFVIYESGRCIVLAETLTPYRINPFTRIYESARHILYNQDKKKIVVNNETILSMFQEHG